MASVMENIYVVGFEGKSLTIPLTPSEFINLKISELKSIIQAKTGVGVKNQRFLYADKQLESVSSGRIMRLGDYGIKGEAIIVLVPILLGGGGGPCFIPLKFADITSEDKFNPIEFSSSAPEWRKVNSGLNFEGTCKQVGCAAMNRTVIVNKRFYESTGGQCMLNFEISKLECPMCNVKLNKKEVLGVGIYKCKLTVKCKPEDKDEISYDIMSVDKYQYAGCIGKKDKIKYEYIMLLVKKL